MQIKCKIKAITLHIYSTVYQQITNTTTYFSIIFSNPCKSTNYKPRYSVFDSS